MAKGSPKASLGMGKASALKAAAASKQAASNASKAKAAKSSVPAYAQDYVKKKAEMNATKSSPKPPKPGAGGRLAGAMQGLGNAVKRTAVNSMQRAAGPKPGGSMLGRPGGTPARMGPPPVQRAGASPMQGLGAAAAGARPAMKKGGVAKKRYT